ncbi:hypothetical protein ABZ370_15275 [Streptomyces sp. NPDC005962]|uniref:cupin domain-containing protein n=1 Tax=Streptomyces sp. NPDC005962 TaxID=3154466 RepID=UPI003409CE24
MENIFNSNDFPARDVLDAWADVTRDRVMPVSFRLVDTDVFHGWLRAMPLGPVRVSAMAYPSSCTLRTPKMIRVSDPECLQVGFMRSGSHVLEQNRMHAPLSPGELVLFDSSRPYVTYAKGNESVVIQFARTLLPIPVRHLEQLICRPLPGDKGIGRLPADFLTNLTDDSASYTPQDAARLGTVAVDLVTAVLTTRRNWRASLRHCALLPAKMRTGLSARGSGAAL